MSISVQYSLPPFYNSKAAVAKAPAQPTNIWKSPIHLDVPNVTIPQLLWGDLSDNDLAGDIEDDSKPLLVDGASGATTYTTGTFRKTVRQVAYALANPSSTTLLTRTNDFQDACPAVSRGTIVGILAFNTTSYALMMQAILLAGGVVSPMNPAAAIDPVHGLMQLEAMLMVSEATAILISPEMVPVVTKVVERRRTLLAGMQSVWILSDLRPCAKGLRRLPVDVVTAAMNQELYPSTQVAPDDLAFICFSSGTTGRPKAVELTHRNVVANVHQLLLQDPTTFASSSRFLAFVPFHHGYGLMLFGVVALFRNITTVVMPMINTQSFDFTLYLSLFAKYQINVAHVVPTIAVAIAKAAEVDHFDMSSLKTVVCAAASLKQETSEELEKRFPGVSVVQYYGMTEAAPATHVQSVKDAHQRGTVGKLVPGIECKIVDEAGRELGLGKAGEILLRGPNIMRGYRKDIKATRKAFTSDGFYRTGDVGVRDEAGFFYVVDRLEELIRYKGFQVAPAELEAILLSHPDVMDAAVTAGWDDIHLTQVPKAFVVLRPELYATQAVQDDACKRIQTYVDSRVIAYKKLRGGVFAIDGIPKTPSGKILRRLLPTTETITASRL